MRVNVAAAQRSVREQCEREHHAGELFVTEPIRIESVDHLRVLTLARADEYNTINP